MNPEQEKARQSAEAAMKIYTPHQVRIYERPYHPNQPTAPLG